MTALVVFVLVIAQGAQRHGCNLAHAGRVLQLMSRVFPGEDAALARKRLHVAKAAWLLAEVAFRARVGDALKP